MRLKSINSPRPFSSSTERQGAELAHLLQYPLLASANISARRVCFQAKGMLLTLSHAWTVGVLLYACEEALVDDALS